MIKRMKALIWLRNQILLSNKNLLVQILLPYLLVLLYKNFMGAQAKGMTLMFICLSTAISMSVGSMISTIIAEEKEKNNLKTLLLSGVRYHEYILSVLVHPIIITIITMVSFPMLTGVTLGDKLLPYIVVVLLTALAVMLINLSIGLLSATQSKAQINGLPILFMVSLLPIFSSMKEGVKEFIDYTFMSSYTDFFTKADFSLTDASIWVLLIWNLGVLALAFLAMKKSKKMSESALEKRTRMPLFVKKA